MLEIPGFLLKALLAGIGVAIVAGPMGAFMVWRRMSYFGDTLSHAGLLGVTLGFVLGISPMIGVVCISLGLAFALTKLESTEFLSTDTSLGILSHTALALGLIVISLLENTPINVLGYLYGDVLAVSWSNIKFIYAYAALNLFILYFIWQPLLLATLHKDLAKVEGISVGKINLIYVLLLAMLVAVAIKVVGVLLITSLLIMPAVAARNLVMSPKILAGLASILGSIAVVLGLCFSLIFDVPAGPSIVLMLALCIVFSMFFKAK